VRLKIETRLNNGNPEEMGNFYRHRLSHITVGYI